MGIESIRIEVQDRQTNTLVAVAWTDENGFFRTEISKMPEVGIDTATDYEALDPRFLSTGIPNQPLQTEAPRTSWRLFHPGSQKSRFLGKPADAVEQSEGGQLYVVDLGHRQGY